MVIAPLSKPTEFGDYRREQLNPVALQVEETDRKNAALKEYMKGLDGFIDEVKAELTNMESLQGNGYKPLLDIREFPDTRMFYTFPLVTENERKDCEKCNVPVVCFGVNSETLKGGKVDLQVIVEDNKETHYLNIRQIDKTVIRNIILDFATMLKQRRAGDAVETSGVALGIAHFLESKGLPFEYETKPVPKYSPYKPETEPNGDNLKDIAWLKENFEAQKPVDQGDEQLVRAKIGDKKFDLLKSGDMVFVMGNKPTIEVLNAAVEARMIDTKDREGFISLQEEMEQKKRTLEQYVQAGNVKGEKKDLRINWQTAEPQYEYDPVRGLYYLSIEGEPVMDEFERKYIQLLGTNAARYGGAVLEIGFGMGISGNAIQEELQKHHKPEEGKPACHIIIEFNHRVAEVAREWGKRQKVPVIVLEGDWVEQIENIPHEILTGSLSDPYPLNPDEKHKDAALALREIHKRLRPGGVSVHYSDSQYCLSPEHEKIAREAGFKYIGGITSSFGAHLNTGEYYAEGLRMMVPALYKEGGTGSEEWTEKKMGPDEVKELMQRLFVENPAKFRSLYNLSPQETAQKELAYAA